MNAHRRLVAWQACRELTRETYRFTGRFPTSERFGICSQLRRAAVSAAANIAEGMARRGARERVHILHIAIGSLAEIDCLIVLSEDLGYLDSQQAEHLDELRSRASRLLFGLIKKEGMRAAA